jgi:hypothetical protein
MLICGRLTATTTYPFFKDHSVVMFCSTIHSREVQIDVRFAGSRTFEKQRLPRVPDIEKDVLHPPRLSFFRDSAMIVPRSSVEFLPLPSTALKFFMNSMITSYNHSEIYIYSHIFSFLLFANSVSVDNSER